MNPGSVPTDGGLGGLASALGGGAPGGGTAGIEAFAMSLVYPVLKPMLEASIRKVTVTVNWRRAPLSRSGHRAIRDSPDARRGSPPAGVPTGLGAPGAFGAGVPGAGVPGAGSGAGPGR